jgi:hypothetical protein
MITLFNPRKKSRGRKRKASRRRKRTGVGGYYSPCTKSGRKHYFKAVRKCKSAAAKRAAARAAKAYPAYAKRSEASYMSSGLFSNGRRRRRARNTGWAPGYALNPGAILGSAKKGFSLDVVTATVPLALGALGNIYARKMIRPYLPAFLQNQWSDAAVGLATAGGLAALTKTFNPGYSHRVLLGGIVQVLSGVVGQFVGGASMGDYLTEQSAMNARPLGGLGQMMQGGWLPPFTQGSADNFIMDSIPAMGPSDNQFAEAIQQNGDNSVADAISADGIADTTGMGELGDYLTQMAAADARPLG